LTFHAFREDPDLNSNWILEMAPVAFFILRDTRYFLNWTLVLDTVPHLSDLLPKRIELSMQKN
jgi:hypothetical protein